MFSGKNALLEIETDTILTQYLSVQLTLDLLDEFIDGVAEYEVTFEGWVRMQV